MTTRTKDQPAAPVRLELRARQYLGRGAVTCLHQYATGIGSSEQQPGTVGLLRESWQRGLGKAVPCRRDQFGFQVQGAQCP